jgi:thiamine kinase-like enzyme
LKQIVQTAQDTAKAEQQLQVLLAEFQAAVKSIAQLFEQELVSGIWLTKAEKDNSSKAYLHGITASYAHPCK